MHFKVILLLSLFTIGIALFTFLNPSKLILAETESCDNSAPDNVSRARGLVTAFKFTTGSKFYTNNSGKCIESPQTGYSQFKLPTYDLLFTKFYIQSKFAGTKGTSLPGSFIGDGLYNIAGGATIADLDGLGTQVIFVDGNLRIDTPALSYPDPGTSGGLVFITRGDINIDQNVDRIDAVLISFGNICTADNGTDCATALRKKLTVNGSIISLKQLDPGGSPDLDPIKFVRVLDDNTEAAEVINYQPKFLPLLKGSAPEGLMTEDLRITIE